MPRPFRRKIHLEMMALLVATSIFASDTPTARPSHFIPVAGSYAELSGTTNVGKWTSRSATILGGVSIAMDAQSLDAVLDKIALGGVVTTLPMSLQDPNIALVFLPVASLNGSSHGMERDLHAALKAKDYPFIRYVVQKLESIRILNGHDANSLAFQMQINGKLSMAGVQRPLAMNLLVHRISSTHFHVEAKAHLLMSDFGVTPPTALFGLIHARNHVDVLFNIELDEHDHHQ